MSEQQYNLGLLLNCNDIDSTYASMEAILGSSRPALRDFLLGIDCGNSPDGRTMAPHEYPYEMIRAGKCFRLTRPQGTCWFHVTRIQDVTVFRKGILPLHEALEDIWATLFNLARDCTSRSEWHKFRTEFETTNPPDNSAGLYRLKTSKHSMGGPFAMLVRESAFYSKDTCAHDYLRSPEIVEDICLAFKEKADVDLLSRYRHSTQPCIVRFFNPGFQESYVTTALYYLYLKAHGQRLSDLSNSCFNGGGRKILPNQILGVETLDPSRLSGD